MTFDFYHLLTPTEFENLCRDVLEIRDAPLTFRTFKEGRDNGIDILSTKSNNKVVGQCKSYNPKNFSSLFSSLKNELKNCESIKPDRYIICVSTELSVDQFRKISKLFRSYIHSDDDIIDARKLNQYLLKQEYKVILKTYSKLLAPNQAFQRQILDEIVNKKYYRETKSFLEDIERKKLLFHQTKHIKLCIDNLEKNKVLIITGNPGIGKTTSAQMLSNYIISEFNIKSVYFLSDKSIDDIEVLLEDDTKQLIVVDDFWGQNFSHSYKSNTHLKNFIRIIEDIKNSQNTLLILTSRQYIIQDVMNFADEYVNSVLNSNSYIISLEDYSFEDKARIFLNHLKFYDYGEDYFQFLSWKPERLASIVYNLNYSPRHVEYFIRLHEKTLSLLSPYRFFEEFQDYLRKPTTFWQKQFSDLNDSAQVILIILMTCDDPLEVQDLEQVFKSIALDAGIQVEFKVRIRDFYSELKLLEDFYIITEREPYSPYTLVKFQSPGIKDYLLEYIRKEGNFWVDYIIRNTIFFNQLFKIFDTKEGIYSSDTNEEAPAYGKKIILTTSQTILLKEKIINDFDRLAFSNDSKSAAWQSFSKDYEAEDEKYWKLTITHRMFNESAYEYEDIKGFILDEIYKDIENFRDNNTNSIVRHPSMYQFPYLIEIYKEELNIRPGELISYYHQSINYSNFYTSFYNFNNIYPLEFKNYLTKNIKRIRDHIRYLVIEDIYYYEDIGDELEIDLMLEGGIKDLFQRYGMRLTKKFVKSIYEETGYLVNGFPELQVTSHTLNKPIVSSDERFTEIDYEAVIGEFLPDEDISLFDAATYLDKNLKEFRYYKTLKNQLEENNSIIHSYGSHEDLLLLYTDFISKEKIELHLENDYTSFNKFLNYFCDLRSLDIVSTNKFLMELSVINESNDSFTLTEIKNILATLGIKPPYEIVEYLGKLSPIIESEKHWYRFCNSNIQVILKSKNYISLDDKKYIKLVESEENHDNILEIIYQADSTRLINLVFIPNLQRLIDLLDFSSNENQILSFIEFSAFEIQLDWEDKELTHNSSTISGDYIMTILGYLLYNNCWEPDFTPFFEIHGSENDYLNPNSQRKIYDYIIANFEPKKYINKISNKEVISFEIVLRDAVRDENFYKLLNDNGLIDYIADLVRQAQNYINRYTVQKDQF